MYGSALTWPENRDGESVAGGLQVTHRERLRRAITFGEPDRAPIHHYIFPGAFFRHGEALVELARRYPDDFDNEAVNPPDPQSVDAITEVVEWQDGWGTVWRRLKGYTSGEVKVPALPTWDGWGAYEFPPVPTEQHFEALQARVAEQHPEWFVCAPGGSLFQHIQHLRGPANLMMDLAEDRQEVHELAERKVEHMLAAIEGYVKTDVDCIRFGDDWGAQSQLLVHPDMWRSFFKPLYKKMFDVAKDAGKFVWFHSDGWIWEIIDDLIEIGVDVLNPQHHCMGDERVAAKAGGRVCIRTDIDRQHLIPFGTPEEIRAYVRKVLGLFGDYGGGIILHGEVGPEVPFENVRALYESYYELGHYPFTWK